VRFFPFKLKVLGAFLTLLTVVLASSLWLVDRSQTRQAKTQIRQQLEVARNVFTSFLNRRDAELNRSLSLLAKDHAFKQALATENMGTIASTLESLKARVTADAIWITDDEGSVMESTRDNASDDELESLEIVESALDEEAASDVIRLGGVPYQLTAVPVLAPDVIGVLIAGFKINDWVAAEIKSVTKSEVSFESAGRIFASTLEQEADRADLEKHLDSISDAEPSLVRHGERRHLVLRAPVAEGVAAYLERSWDEAIAPLEALRRIVFSIGIAGFLLTALAGLFVAGNVTAPVAALVKATRRLSGGDLDTRVDVRQNDELGELGRAFNEMAGGLREKEKFRSVLNKAVSKEIAEELLKTGKIELGGEERRVTVLFSDIRSFTSLSESLSPQELIAQLNDYFKRMGGPIDSKKGVIDKYIGDAIMALWGAPVSSEDDALRAQSAALGMLGELDALNAERARDGLPPLDIGIGLHSGSAVAGNLGSENRASYTVIGDAVNLASRVEGLTKHYGAKIVVTADVRAASANGRFLYRSLDLVRVKGKKKPVEVFELLGETADEPEWLADYEFGVAAYRSGDFRAARERLAPPGAARPGDRAVTLYLERLQILPERASDNWNPAHTMTEK
jgi:adenylate cyclase